jgi:hypothetical protein
MYDLIEIPIWNLSMGLRPMGRQMKKTYASTVFQ